MKLFSVPKRLIQLQPIVMIPLILMGLFVGCQNQKPESKGTLIQSHKDKIDELGNRYLELNRFGGIILVKKGDSVLYQNTFGLADYAKNIPLNRETVFKVGEITEWITAGIIQEMIKKGKLDLNDSIKQYIYALEENYSIADLLDHGTNLPSIAQIQQENPEEAYNTIKFANLGLKSELESFESDLDYNILGMLIEEISGESYQYNVEQYAKRLGLTNTYYLSNDSNLAQGYIYHSPDGKGLILEEAPSYDKEVAFSSKGIKSTAQDVAKILEARQGKFKQKYGYLPEDGFSYLAYENPISKLKIVILSNRRHPVADEMAASIESIIKEEGYQLPLLRKPVSVSRKLLKDYEGVYALNENVHFNVITKKDSLYVLVGPDTVSLTPQSENQFFMEYNDAAMRFNRDATGKVYQVELLNGFMESTQQAKKINSSN